MYCKKCGSKLEENSRFCGNCGEPVREDRIVYCIYCGGEMHESETMCTRCGKAVKNENEDNSETILLAIVSFLIPILGLILWVVFKDKNERRAKIISQAALIGFIFWFFKDLLW